jgi:hypothetical protein
MTDETPTPQPETEEFKPDFEQAFSQLYRELEEFRFFSSQPRFNATLFQGFNLILEKLVKLEEKLGKIEEKLNDKPKQPIIG